MMEFLLARTTIRLVINSTRQKQFHIQHQLLLFYPSSLEGNKCLHIERPEARRQHPQWRRVGLGVRPVVTLLMRGGPRSEACSRSLTLAVASLPVINVPLSESMLGSWAADASADRPASPPASHHIQALLHLSSFLICLVRSRFQSAACV